MTNINITKHDFIHQYLQDSIKNNNFYETEEELNDVADIQPKLEEIQKATSFEIEEVDQEKEDPLEQKVYKSTDSDISEEVSEDKEEKKTIKVNHSIICKKANKDRT